MIESGHGHFCFATAGSPYAGSTQANALGCILALLRGLNVRRP